MSFIRTIKPPKLIIYTPLGRSTTSKITSYWEAAFGQAEGYIDQYFAKASYKFDIAGSPLTTSYQFYGTRDKVDDRSVNDLYDGTAWLQALTFGYRAADVVDLRLEGTWVKADGQQGYFLQRMTQPTLPRTVAWISGGITVPTSTPTAKKRSSSVRCMT